MHSGCVAKRGLNTKVSRLPTEGDPEALLRIQQTNWGHRIDKIELASSFLTTCVSSHKYRYFNISFGSRDQTAVLIYNSQNTHFFSTNIEYSSSFLYGA